MWEAVLSLQLLQHRQASSLFDGWRRRVRGNPGTWARLLLPLAPNAAYFPDFLTPSGGTAALEEGIDAVLSTPVRRMRSELRLLSGHRRLPGWTTGLVHRDTTALARLGDALRSYHAMALRPFWSSVRSAVDADRDRRSRALLENGVEGMLAGFSPTMRWRAPVLECDYPVERDLHLEGRGLLLIPAFFCLRTPVALADPSLSPALVYPIEHESAVAPDDVCHARAERALEALLGRTRAAVLCSIAEGCTTTELGRRAGISVPSASQHATVLRNARLIVTRRYGSAVIHTLTPLGTELIAGRNHNA
ncbi:ArsR/SmtB family transcription factor [Actinoallomurus acanthiterrae]